jgi:hypothetical protein
MGVATLLAGVYHFVPDGKERDKIKHHLLFPFHQGMIGDIHAARANLPFAGQGPLNGFQANH